MPLGWAGQGACLGLLRRGGHGDARGHWGGGAASGRSAAQLFDHCLNDLAHSLRARKRRNVLRLHIQLLLNVAQDLDALDRVDAQLRLQSHVHLDHVRLVARLGRQHSQHHPCRLSGRHAHIS